MSSACNRRRHWPECVGRVNRTFCFTGTITLLDYITTAPPPNLTRLLHNTASHAGYTNPVKAFNGMCVRLTSITFPGRRATQLGKLTSHLGRFTLWHNGCRATQLGRFTLWHNGRRATQLGKFTLWHNGRRTKPVLMYAPGVAGIFQRQGQIMLKNMKAWSKVKFNSNLKDEGFGQFSNHRSMYALGRFSKLFKRWTLYADRISDLSKPLKDERNTWVSASKWGKKQASFSKRGKCVSTAKKHPLLIAQDTQ